MTATSQQQENEMNGFADIEPEEISIPVPWGHVAGKWWGSRSIQPIIGIHGRQDNAGSFDNLMKLLMINNNNNSYLCLDLPGHGYSSNLKEGQYYFIYWDSVTLLRRIAKHYQWNKIKILGHSLGGAIGFLYAASFPDEVDLLISLDIASPSVRNVVKSAAITGDHIDKYLKYEKLTLDNVPCYEYDEMISIVLDAYNGDITRESAETLMKRGMQPAPEPGKYFFSRDSRLKVSMLGLLSVDLTKAYAELIKCPYLNIRAVQGLKLDLPGHYDEILDIIKKNSKKFEYQTVEGTHHVHLNEPEKVAPIIKQFLNSL